MEKAKLAKIYSNLKILVVDDFENFRSSIRQMLRTFGCADVQTARNGEEALEKCIVNKFDLILCDYNMGSGKNGQQILEDLRYNKRLSHTALFVLITAEQSKEVVMGAREYQPDCYIAKPITRSVLQKRLDNMIVQREMLKPINKELDLENYPKAITLCNQLIKTGTRFQSWCFRTLANLYYLTGDYTYSKKIYEDILSKREIIWARIGLGRVLLAQQDYEGAKDCFNRVIEEDANMVEAYDGLASANENLGRKRDAQKILEKAVSISPRAVPRQQHLAELSEINQDLETATNAYRATVKFSENSVFEKPENYLNLGRCIADISSGDDSKRGKELTKEACNVLKKASRRYDDNEVVKASASLIEARVYAGQNRKGDAEKAMQKAQSHIEKAGSNAEVSLELAETLFSLDRGDEAEKILHKMAQEYESDPAILAKVESLIDEPFGLQQKLKARELNRQGIKFFEEGKLDDAIKTFMDALLATPKHPSLNLNLVQVILKHLSKTDQKAYYINVAKDAIQKLSHIPPQHRQFKRFNHLSNKIKEAESKLSTNPLQ